MKKLFILMFVVCFLLFAACSNEDIAEDDTNIENNPAYADTDDNNDDNDDTSDNVQSSDTEESNEPGEKSDENVYLTYQSETIGNVDIEYDKYYTVVIEDYHGIHSDELTEIGFVNPLYIGEQMVQYNVAVFGPIKDVSLTRKYAVSGDEEGTEIADSINDSMIKISTRMFSDTSYDIFSFTGPDGQEHEMTIDDMSGIIDIIAINENGETKFTIQ